MANTLKHTVNNQTAKISTFGIAVVSMLYGYSRQRRTIGSLSATAWLLVIFRLLPFCLVVCQLFGVRFAYHMVL